MRILISLLCCAAAIAQQKSVVAISHRGEHLHHPENTMPAFEEAVRVGADFFELDVRTTSDGKLVLMHDSTVNRTTNGTGEVAQMTFDEIRKLDAGAKMNFPGTRVPTFDEALAYSKGKIGIYVDVKSASAKDLVDHITSHSMTGAVVIYANRNAEEIHQLDPRLKLMPEARNPETAERWIRQLALKVLAFDANDFRPEVIAVAKRAGVEIYVDRLGPADNEASWQSAIDQGAAGIQTDHPEALVKFLRDKGYHK